MILRQKNQWRLPITAACFFFVLSPLALRPSPHSPRRSFDKYHLVTANDYGFYWLTNSCKSYLSLSYMLTGNSCSDQNARDLWVPVKVSPYIESFFFQEKEETKIPLAGKLLFKAMLEEKKVQDVIRRGKWELEKDSGLMHLSWSSLWFACFSW